jgi:hypothetical protein
MHQEAQNWIRFKNGNQVLERCSLSEFSAYWSQFYRASPSDDVYFSNIKFDFGQKYTSSNLRELMRWKAGSQNKKSGEAFANKIDLSQLNGFRESINSHTSQIQYELFFNRNLKNLTRSPESFVWPRFVLHIASPRKIPIFDRHAWRSFRFLNGEMNSDNLISSASGGDFWPFVHWVWELEKYVDFSARDLDRALWGFGKELEKAATHVKNLHLPASAKIPVAKSYHPGLFHSLSELWNDGMAW